MHTPTINPILHSVWALTKFCEAIRDVPHKRLKLGHISQLGDVLSHRMPGDKALFIPLNHELDEHYIIKDHEAGWDFEDLDRVYITPAIERMTRKFLANTGALVQFARIDLSPECFGGLSFRTDHSDLAFRCTMQYSPQDQGTFVRLNALYGAVTPETEQPIAPVLARRAERFNAKTNRFETIVP